MAKKLDIAPEIKITILVANILNILIYPTFCGRARQPVPNERMHKLNMHPCIESGPIFPNGF